MVSEDMFMKMVEQFIQEEELKDFTTKEIENVLKAMVKELSLDVGKDKLEEVKEDIDFIKYLADELFEAYSWE